MSMQACNEYASVMSEHGKLAWKTSTGDVLMTNISPLYKFSLKGGGWDEQRQPKMQPSAEIVRVECAKCRRECDLPAARATLCGDRACRVREMQARARFARCARNPLRRSCVSSVRNAGESAICPVRAQPSAKIVRVECAKCRRECDLPAVRATLCGDRACRVREMQARARFARCARNPLQRSCVSSARNAGESEICPVRAQPFAEIARVECAKCRRECDLPGACATLCGDCARRVREMQARVRLSLYARNPLRRSGVSGAKCRRLCSRTLVRGVAGELEAENWRLCSTTLALVDENWRVSSTTLVRGVARELEDENWRLCSTTLVRGVSAELEDENWRLCSTT